MIRHPIRSLATLLTMWASPEMERPTYWNALIRRDTWALILITKGRPGDPPPPPARQEPPRVSPEWLRRTGAELAPEQLLHERIGQYLRHHVQRETEVDVARAASIAVDAVLSALTELGIDITTAQRPPEVGDSP